MTRQLLHVLCALVTLVAAPRSGRACLKGVHCHSVAQVADAVARAERALLHRRSAKAGELVLTTFPGLHRLPPERLRGELRRHGAHILAVAARRTRGLFKVNQFPYRRERTVRVPLRWAHETLKRLAGPWPGHAGAVFVQGPSKRRLARLGSPPHDQARLIALLGEPDPGLRLAAITSLQRQLTGRPCAKARAKPGCAAPEAAVVALVTRLGDPVVSVRHAAATALASIGPATSPKLAALALLARDRAAIVRVAASQAMGTHGKRTPALVRTLLGLLGAPDAELRESAATALGRHVAPLPRSILPRLIRYLETKPHSYRSPYVEDRRCGANSPFKRMAIRALAAMGKEAAPATGALVALLDHGGFGVEAREALAGIGPSVIPALRRVLAGTDHHAKVQALYGLAELGKRHAAAIAPVVARLDDGDRDLRTTAVRALIHTCGAKAIGPLCTGLRSKHHRVRLHSAEALAGLGRHAARCAPQLIALLDGAARHEARSALEAAGPAVAPALTRALEHASPRVRRGAAMTLAAFGPKARSALDPLRKLLGDPDAGVRAAAATGLGRIGPAGRPAIDDLLRAVRHKTKNRDRWRDEAIEALGRIGANRPDVVAALTAILGQRACRSRVHTDSTAVAAAMALGRIGNNGPAVLQTLRARLASGETGCRASAAWALARLGARDRGLIAQLVRLLRLRDRARRSPDGHLWVWRLAAEACARIGPAARRAIPHLERLARAQPYGHIGYRGAEHTEAAAVAALAAIGPAALRALARVVDTGDTEVRRAAVRALGRIGPPARRALAALVRACREHWSTAEDLRLVIEALARIGTRTNKAATRLLRRAAADDRAPIRRAAAAAMAAPR